MISGILWQNVIDVFSIFCYFYNENIRLGEMKPKDFLILLSIFIYVSINCMDGLCIYICEVQRAT